MSTAAAIRSYLIFTGTGPILVLSTYPGLTDPRLIEKLQYKCLAYQGGLGAGRQPYAPAFAHVTANLAAGEDSRVVDFNGHQIMTNFSLDELGEPIKFGG